ncbi:phage-related protein [Halalkalibacter wakoensis JCM 9140]|uniref:Phage-related protein n=1 Tax=Halalkalibacter wakoensis JCM 9140 TaxID=1236970 RepID=W4Q5Q3_9BACI|nr:head-tail connector protein [Halalkalibacter wakoensis]GAE27023.1 phage-related protein [Halalkalibacter wakoensis JCM 9140]
MNLPEVKEWLRIDGNDEDSTLDMLIGASQDFLRNSTGYEYEESNNLAKMYCLVLITDWYENRELIGEKPSDKIRLTIQSIATQLKYSYGGDD